MPVSAAQQNKALSITAIIVLSGMLLYAIMMRGTGGQADSGDDGPSPWGKSGGGSGTVEGQLKKINKKLDRLAEALVSLQEDGIKVEGAGAGGAGGGSSASCAKCAAIERKLDNVMSLLKKQAAAVTTVARPVAIEADEKPAAGEAGNNENEDKPAAGGVGAGPAGREVVKYQQVSNDGLDAIDMYNHPGKTFLNAARQMSWATDKVTYHRYDYLYEKYLGPLRNRPFKILEIGLGCSKDMYAPGHGYALLKKYVPHVKYHAIEYNQACPEWLRRIGQMSKEEAIRKKHPVFGSEDAEWIIDHTVWGDQSNPAVMQQVVSKFGNDFDVIIDDGSHISDHMVNSMKFLFDKALKPGGVYIVEDIQMVFTPGNGGDRRAQEARKTFVAFVQDLLLWQQFEWWAPAPHKNFMQGTKHTDIVEWLRNIDCDREICAFGKLLSRHGPNTFHRPRALPEEDDYTY